MAGLKPAERVRLRSSGFSTSLDLDGEVEMDETDDVITATVEGDEDYGFADRPSRPDHRRAPALAFQAAFRGIRERKRVVVDAAGTGPGVRK